MTSSEGTPGRGAIPTTLNPVNSTGGGGSGGRGVAKSPHNAGSSSSSSSPTSSSAAPGSFVGGLSVAHRRDDAANLLRAARNDGYEFCVTALPHDAVGGRVRTDVMALDSRWWCTSVVGEVVDPSSGGPSGGGGDRTIAGLSDDEPSVRKRAERRLSTALSWAGHMNVPAVILPAPSTDAAAALDYARALSGLALRCGADNVQLWVRTPFSAAGLEAYRLLCARCDHAENLGCLLCFGPSTGGEGGEDASVTTANSGNNGNHTSVPLSTVSLLHRFLGHNLKAVSFHTAVFLTNKRLYPTLSRSYQLLFTELLRRLGRTVRVLVEGGCRHRPLETTSGTGPNASSPRSDANGETGCLAYLQYLRHLRSRPEVASVLDTPEGDAETPYLDHLQSPLQPLGDDLEFNTYETFERDPIKYRNYQTAVELCLRDKLLTLLDSGSGGKGDATSTVPPFTPLSVEEKMRLGNGFTHLVTILVVGAGRGPLVRSSLAAVASINCQQHQNSSASQPPRVLLKAHVIAIEKNPSAVLFLRSLCAAEEHWDEDTVTVVDCDMRRAGKHATIRRLRERRARADSSTNKSGAKHALADVVVSELLGSFGDNELSPECLDGAQRSGLLKPDCVSVPQSYTSHLAPVSSHRLHSEARSYAYSPTHSGDGPEGQPYGVLRALETPYVVRAHSAAQTHRERPCFSFRHPAPAKDVVMKGAEEGDEHGRDDDDDDEHGGVVGNDYDLRAVLEFPPDPTYGAGFGSGYGGFDSSAASLARPGEPGGGVGDDHASTGVTVHGFLGSFHAVLYKSPIDAAESTISIAPSTFSKGMFSWFPLYFPLKTPLHVPRGATLRCAMWRRTAEGRVWYEWCAEVLSSSPPATTSDGRSTGPATVVTASTAVHNPNGRSYHVRL